MIIFNMAPMDLLKTLHPYLSELLLIRHHPYFELAAILLTVSSFFLLGRLAHEKKLTTLLDMVNDADTTRKQISQKLTSTSSSSQSIRIKKKYLLAITAILLLANLGIFYIGQKIDLKMIGGSASVLASMWILYLGRTRYLDWSKKRLQENLRRTSMNAEVELKQIIKLLGENVTKKLKDVFEREMDEQWRKQSGEDCRLAKCSNQKQAFRELYDLYDQTIDQIKQITLCDICLAQQNISIQKLRLGEFEIMFRNCKKAVSGVPSLEQKKEIVNRLLLEYQKMYENMQYVCKRGCCIRQRILIESAKAKNHDKIKRAMGQLQL